MKNAWLFFAVSFLFLAAVPSLGAPATGEALKDELIRCPSVHPTSATPVTVQIFGVSGGPRRPWVSSYASAFAEGGESLEGLGDTQEFFIDGNSYVFYYNLNDLNGRNHRRITVIRLDKQSRTAHILDTDHRGERLLNDCTWTDGAFHQ